jgi:PHP family Zn ribbon phosphoesterase
MVSREEQVLLKFNSTRRFPVTISPHGGGKYGEA